MFIRTVIITLLMAMPAAAQTSLTPATAAQGHAHTSNMMHSSDTTMLEPGQGAFAAIGEIVAALEADPNTDWLKVDIAGLRAHLRDMDIVMIDSAAHAETVQGGMQFTVTGSAEVAPSIQRMVLAHAAVMQGVNGWKYQAAEIANGATLVVTVPDSDLPKLNGLGFYGILTSGMHHQAHHFMMATGGNPHQ
ncbi:MAG: hypothetical protein HQ479_09140 [Rhodobacter sp.]|jgi:hypothetical protein|nr:hypothetical protein [Rhodobacter sp.]